MSNDAGTLKRCLRTNLGREIAGTLLVVGSFSAAARVSEYIHQRRRKERKWRTQEGDIARKERADDGTSDKNSGEAGLFHLKEDV
ncbi:hypothetical protein QLX08_002277 [Tetragonisca angustula]|uniref:Uncharacterized protein n=1 Tax=Tetragonisca angustula TaxID=166442 RepID=A0AAW1AC37_9HYME